MTQKTKITRYTKTKIEKVFEFVSINFIGPFPISRDYRYCSMSIDRFTSRTETTTLKDLNASAVPNAFLGCVSMFGW